MSTKAELFTALHRWIDHVMHDESIGFAEAAEVVIAKMSNEAATSKRQTMYYNESGKHFEVRTDYVIDHPAADGGLTQEHKYIVGTPHTEVFAYGAVRTGCITFTRNAIAKLYFLSHSEPHMFHDGYMVKGLKK